MYQVPAVLLPGPTVVVSPLLALQRDQVQGLAATAAPDAVAVNSAQRDGQNERAWEAVRAGDAEYVFLSPEQLAKDEIVERLKPLRPSLFVVDEAHCVSAWGHDFRPDYLRLRHVLRRLGGPPVLAMTATAGGPVRADVTEHLGLRDPVEVIAGFDRPNLSLAARVFAGDDQRRAAVLDWVAGGATPGLVYVATRKDAERYAEALAGRGLAAAAFHAGLRAAERDRVHDGFKRGTIDVVVATSAFGMGIDKSDVRFVGHASAPGSLDAYYQEIGRAGRDGEPADALLFYRLEDLGLQRFLNSRSVDDSTVGTVAETVRRRRQPARLADLHEELDQPERRITNAVNLLEQAGVLKTGADGRLRFTGPAEGIMDRVSEVAERQRQLDRSRIEVVSNYAEIAGCRRRFLLGYFGENLTRPCGNCDNCVTGYREPSTVDCEYPAGTVTYHREWGRGTVVHHEPDRITIQFDSVGYKTLSLAAVRDNRLLADEPA